MTTIIGDNIIKTRKQIIGECIDTLTVFECTNKIRIGNERDGGYVVMDLSGYDFLLSGGVGGDIGFEKSFTDKYNVHCICFDGTEQSGIELTKNEPRIQYINKNVGPTNTENISNFDFAFEKYNNIFMKLDIEGAEFDLFHSFTIEQLKKIRQLVMEVHFPHQLYHWQMLEKLSQTHYLIHYHANNNNYVIYNMNHKSIPAVFECTYIRKDLLPNPLLNKEPFPTKLDTRNVTGKLDYLIDCPPWVHKYTTIHTFGDSHASRG